MSDDPSEWIRSLIKAQQEQTESLINAQKEQFSEILENVISMFSKVSSAPTFVAYDSSKEKFSAYLSRLQHHFQACGISDSAQKKSRFLSWVGSETYTLLGKIRPGFEKDCSFEEISHILSEYEAEEFHFIHARVEFNRCNLKPNQTYREWVAELRAIAERCGFKCPKKECQCSLVDENIRDAIILRTPHKNIQSALLQQKSPTLEQVLSIAGSMLMTSKTMKAIEMEDTECTVNKISSRLPPDNKKIKWKSCKHCGVSHERKDCRHFSKICSRCNKLGHIKEVCMTKLPINRFPKWNSKYRSNNSINELVVNSCELISLSIGIENLHFPFLVDTGASCSIINSTVFDALGIELKEDNSVIKSFGGAEVAIRGYVMATISYKGNTARTCLFVANSENNSNILGLDSIKGLRIDLNNLFSCNQVIQAQRDPRLKTLLAKYRELFDESRLGECKNIKAKLYMKEGAVPKFSKARNIPFALREKTKAELDRLVERGVLTKIDASDWAFPIVIVPKPDGSIRICADFRDGLNSQLNAHQHPIPTVDDLLMKLNSMNIFSKIDLSDAYFQIPLDEDAKKLLVIHTPFGLYQYNRLPFGISSAPAIFQRYLESLLVEIPNCASFMDDIIVSGSDVEDHLKSLGRVLNVLQENGLSCKLKKCDFFKQEVIYLGQILSRQGIRPSPANVDAIIKIPSPKNLRELECFLGKTNYYCKYIPKYSTICGPLNILRKKNIRFSWGKSQEDAFRSLKSDLANATLLTKFNPTLPLLLSTDASPVGIAAVLSHRLPDGSERPISHSSKILNPTQSRYSQMEKEGLAVIYGLKKYNQFLYGRPFEIITDNKSLTSLFSQTNKFPILA
ncbi:Retrovirus-related Pol polyprotein from transposon 17.6 [Thelohanellus kitauei]|uniref:Retrovirus-related Pol polyprotein from transposon 17.6 n=1 Tax=Thelohanellus kitauei TaxID=669202 RepID=A0A0C2MEP4_THEKT|nr:Retrovirus-related Pol polyprotein from transposon 17.6 [Thelohanellus kitauei]